MFRLDYNSNVVRNSGSYEYWKNRLSARNNYKLTLADKLVDAFDYPLVFVNGIQYSLDQDELTRLVDVITQHCFGCNSNNVKFECCDIKGINDRIDGRLLQTGIFEVGVNILSCNTVVIQQSKNTYVLFNTSAYQNVKFKDVVLDVIHALVLCSKSETVELNAISELGWKKYGSTTVFNVDFSAFNMFNDIQNDLYKVEVKSIENMFYAKNVVSGQSVTVFFG